MVHWAWIPITLFVGVVIGFFLLAFMEVSRRDDNNKKWWEE